MSADDDDDDGGDGDDGLERREGLGRSRSNSEFIAFPWHKILTRQSINQIKEVVDFQSKVFWVL